MAKILFIWLTSLSVLGQCSRMDWWRVALRLPFCGSLCSRTIAGSVQALSMVLQFCGGCGWLFLVCDPDLLVADRLPVVRVDFMLSLFLCCLHSRLSCSPLQWGSLFWVRFCVLHSLRGFVVWCCPWCRSLQSCSWPAPLLGVVLASAEAWAHSGLLVDRFLSFSPEFFFLWSMLFSALVAFG